MATPGPTALPRPPIPWPQYAYNAVKMLAELVHERGSVDAQRLPVTLEGIAAFIEMGIRCATQAHLRMHWQQA